MPPPSTPLLAIITSPRVSTFPQERRTDFSGSPAKREMKCSDQSTSKPQLAGTNGRTSNPRAANTSHQRASEPSLGHDAPPSAKTYASKRSGMRTPVASAMIGAPASSKPLKEWRARKRTPIPSKRRKMARSNGEALKLFGNTRPLEPAKVGSPSSSLQARSISGVKAAMIGNRCVAAAP